MLLGCQAAGAVCFGVGLVMIAGPAWAMLIGGAVVAGVAILAEMRS